MPDRDNREEIFSKAVKAGKRTYFFDVKSTKANDLYLTITESKKRYNQDGKFTYEKHKLFLYKEDFDKFGEGFLESVEHIKSLQGTNGYASAESERGTGNYEDKKEDSNNNDEYSSSVSFDELG